MKTAQQPYRPHPLLCFAFAASLAGCAASKHDPRDPWEGWNRGVQSFNDTLDDYAMKPAAKAYQYITPSVVDQGITNFFNNVDDIAVIANDLLQFKLLQTGQDLGRFMVNTTLGLGGFIDVARHLDLPKHNEDLDQTLGAWGIPSGPYLVLPFMGPSTPRGVLGVAGDTLSNPINWINPTAIPWGAGTLKTIDTRADLLSASKIVDEASVDRYEFIRNAYFQQRKYLIYDGNPPLDEEMEKDLELEGLESGGSSAPAAESNSGDAGAAPPKPTATGP
ncbi:MlaA family lipoprotein [Candidatus Methylocalor cossyra]|uniref:Phospholipid-binding lipoprotein MlaA n=1 Tax=Candidatus Methylocalor cossyra TaxID=3108543 RepID=A0ABM9NJB8_9GAMM